MKANNLVSALLAMALTSSAFAGDVIISRCNLKFANALNRLEVKGASALEIIEFKIDKPIDYIFGENKLKMVPLESKFAEKKALYRYPGVASKVLDRFEQTRFIQDMPPKDFATLLEPNAVYTYTIQDKKLTIAKSKPGVIRDYASKHMLLSADSEAGELRMAGEMWKDEKGILHYDPGSGTYKPSNEDLNRAEIFFRDHLGIKNSKAHYFEPPVPSATAEIITTPKTSLTSKVKKIEIAQIAILQNRRALGAFKFSIGQKNRMKEIDQHLNAKRLQLKSEDGHDVTYMIKKNEMLIKEVVEFDTKNSFLQQKHALLQSSRSFKLSEEKSLPPISLKASDHAVKYARASGAGNSPLVPVSKHRTEEVEYALYPLDANGKAASKPAFVISLESKTSTDLLGAKTKSEYSATIKDESSDLKNQKQLQQVTAQLETQLGLQ